jgi:uncharacterized protein YxjI
MSNTYGISGLDLHDDSYEVSQSLIRNKYKATDARGNVILRAKQKMFKAMEELPFADGDGEEVFTVRADVIWDVAGDYTLTDARTGEDVVVLDNDFSMFRDSWTIRDPDGAALAEINSRGALVSLARGFVPFGMLIPHRYEITEPDGSHVGNIGGKLSFRDRYAITIDDASNVPREVVIASAMVIDAIQNN